ncbi:type IV secretory system conjugative DNA transfer family protein [Thermoanaerobaculum aquaticum]|nr:type IV secretion system DNA-binding domain-containing protein [Thermoanaerobaculum aquaticum]
MRTDELVTRHLSRQVDLINSLYSPSPPRAYALRYLSRPHPSSFSAGEIAIVLFGKAEDSEKFGCYRRAHALYLELSAVLGGMMPHHAWSTVTDQKHFESLWQPMEWEMSSVAEIRRREGRVSLETIRPRPVLGKTSTKQEATNDHGETVYFIHAFLPRPSTMARLLRTMLLQPAPVVLQVALAPVQLAPQEEEAMVAEIARSEQYLQRRHTLVSEGAIAVPTILSRRAEAICEGLLGQLLRLQDAPFLMHILVASPQPLSPTLLETVGVEVTRPVGEQLQGNLAGLQMGGYDVAIPSTPSDRAILLGNLQHIEFTPWGNSSAPPSLRRVRWLVDAQEAAGAFRFPVATAEGLPGLGVQHVRMQPVPREASIYWQKCPAKKRTQVGESSYLGLTEPVYLAEQDRRQHVYIVGQTGTGKTTLIKKMIVADMQAGNGLAVIDPHGDLFDELLSHIPPHRLDDVVILDPTDTEYPVGVNLLECDPDQRYFVVREMRAIMERLIRDQFDQKAAEYAGPAFYQHMQMNMLLAMSNPDNPGTLLEFYEIFQHPNYWKRWLPLRWSDPQLARWTTQNLRNLDYTHRFNDSMTWGEYLSSKFEDFVFDPKLRLIFGQRRSTINLRQIMDGGQILLVNLAKGQLAEANSRFLGMVLMSKILAAAMERASLPPGQRRTFYLYVDEFQALATESFTLLLSEARKFGVALVLANQFLSQIRDQNIVQSIFGNVGTVISFRVGQADGEILETHFSPYFDVLDLTSLPNWNACVRPTVGGNRVIPFTMRTILLDAPRQKATAQAARERSRALYGRPRELVEAEIRGQLMCED